MSKIDLSTLPSQELRQLLDSARQRGHAAQSYEILREMDARRAGARPPILKSKRGRRRREPRLIELQLGDPLERPDPLFESSDEEPPLTLGDAAPATTSAAAVASPARQRWGHWGAMCFAVGLGAGVAAGWWAAWGGAWQAPAPTIASAAQSVARPQLPVTVSEPAPPAAPLAPTPAAADVQLASAGDTSGSPPASQPPLEASPEASGSAPSATAEPPAHTKVLASQDRMAEAASEEKACIDEPTPADETICAEPRLRALQAELRRAYAQALEAHEDRSLLRERQLAWRDGRNAISNPNQLARLYVRRIEQLKAATAQAIRER